ncbi:MAG: hypothetical protein DRR19_05590 [Candidatus Parabeggiatoa sp. nov. 1]|nr:MAG: hypothetical protein DRR19_05590 [Gammaproteobacteria bacterium]
MSQTTPEIIPIPPDFPVHWEKPEHEQWLWILSAATFSKAFTPLEYDLIGKPIFVDGINFAYPYYQFQGNLIPRLINFYLYFSVRPNDSAARVDEDTLQYAMDNLGKLWEGEWLPEIRSHLNDFESYDLIQASLPQLSKYLDEMFKRTKRLWEIHFLVFGALIVVLDQFESMYHDLFGEENQFTAYQLLAGLESQSVKVTQDLWQLSRQVLSNPLLHNIFSNTPASEVMEKLEATPVAQTFLTSFNGFIQRYGTQCQVYYLHLPSWREMPSQVIGKLQSYLAQPERDLIAEYEQVKTQREKAIAEARSRLVSYPQPVVAKFEHLLQTAQMANYLREEHAHWLDIPITYHVRQVILAIGHHLQGTGVIKEIDDIFYLTYEELQKVVHSPEAVSQSTVVIQQRREAKSHFVNIAPPPRLGTVPTGQPLKHPIIDAILRKLAGTPLPPSEQSDILAGHAGSPGIVKGRVKVLTSPEELDQVVAKDIILVTTSTTPDWSSVFAQIIGLVTDRGGVLSHAAVVAREIGIPAVVGTGQATTLLKDGQLVEVNGNTGQVQILE